MKYNILLADESNTILEVVSFAFEYFDSKVFNATNYDEIHKLLENHEYDIILIEYNFSDEKLVKKIFNSKKGTKPFVFILSENTDFETKTKAKKMGIEGWILKPFIPEKLAKTLLQYIENNTE